MTTTTAAMPLRYALPSPVCLAFAAGEVPVRRLAIDDMSASVEACDAAWAGWGHRAFVTMNPMEDNR